MINNNIINNNNINIHLRIKSINNNTNNNFKINLKIKIKNHPCKIKNFLEHMLKNYCKIIQMPLTDKKNKVRD